LALVVFLVLPGATVAMGAAGKPERPKNFFANPSFEMGRDGWNLDKGGATVAQFTVDKDAAADGELSALITIDTVAEWGVQFGQTMEGGQTGKTYTFAAVAKAVKDPVKVALEIERRGKPYDRAARSDAVTIAKDEWTEIHVTFKLDKPFPEGWFAYLSCAQAKSQFRVDAFRLYEGEYVPYKQQAKEQAGQAAVRLLDTGAASAEPIGPDALSKKTGWAPVPEDKTSHEFKGDAVFLNDKLAVVLRRKGRGAEVYATGPGGLKMRSLLAPVGAAVLSSVKIVENSPSAVSLDAAFKAADGKALVLNYELKMGQVFVKAEPRANVWAARVESPCRFAVLPDFFADDIVVDATEVPVAKGELPSENFLLHMLDDREAIVMDVWTGREEDVGITLSGQGAAKMIDGAEIPYGKKGKVWVGVMTGQGIWHSRDLSRNQAGTIVPLDWRPPFPAQWRVDWRRDDHLADSWEMIAEQPDGKFVKSGWFGSAQTIPADRKRWTTVLGSFQYPCWIDRGGQGFLQPFKKGLTFEGPVLVYPINRAAGTPLSTYTVVDLVRATLGVGPCEYVLDVEGQQSQNKGRATCANRDTLNPIYQSGQQKAKRAEIEKSLSEVMVFIRYIRARVEGYVSFGHEVLKYLDQQKKAHPELTERLDELAALARVIDAKFDVRKNQIKTPDQAAEMVEAFRKSYLDYEGTDALKKCKEFTAAIVDIGGSQDELVGECRWAVKVLRQRSGMLMAVDPRIAEVAREIRRRSQEVLRTPAGHEGARH
jgi:hypothetical protein